jgi:hypothetical protein
MMKMINMINDNDNEHIILFEWWFGHVERKGQGECVSACRYLEVEEKVGRGRPRMTWDERLRDDMVYNEGVGIEESWCFG